MLGVRDLRFRYNHSTEELFDGLTHDFAVGRVTAVTGPSGRGKSTLLYVLGMLLTPSAGQVVLAGREVGSLSDAERSRARSKMCGFVFQDAALDPARTVLDSVVEPALYAGRSRDEARAAARAALDALGIGIRADHRPGEISGGQAQRVAVARAMVNDPVVVLADEPTGNLDRDNAVAVLNALRSGLTGERCVVIATHDPFVVDHADSVVAL